MTILTIQSSNTTNELSGSIFEILLTEQLLPATLTFIAAVLGIIAQIIINQITSQHLHRSEIKKYRLNCVKNFYIPLMNDLISYNTNLKILQSQIDDLNIFDSNNSNLRKYNTNLMAVYNSIKNISQINLDHYYPINKKLNSETMEMLFYMIKSAQIISLPVDSRDSILLATKISTDGYDVEPLLNMIYSQGIPKGI